MNMLFGATALSLVAAVAILGGVICMALTAMREIRDGNLAIATVMLAFAAWVLGFVAFNVTR